MTPLEFTATQLPSGATSTLEVPHAARATVSTRLTTSRTSTNGTRETRSLTYLGVGVGAWEHGRPEGGRTVPRDISWWSDMCVWKCVAGGEGERQQMSGE